LTGLKGSTGFAINRSKGRLLRPSAIASSRREGYYAEMSMLISSLEPSIPYFERTKPEPSPTACHIKEHAITTKIRTLMNAQISEQSIVIGYSLLVIG
jgi:hypothetical protein